MEKLMNYLNPFQYRFIAGCLAISHSLTGQAGQAPLADAVQAGDAVQIETLLARSIDVDAPQIDKMTALHWAAYNDDAELARQLLERGASATVMNRYKVSPLYLACLNGNEDLVRLLLDSGVDPNTAVHGDETALMTAARTGKIGTVEALIEAGAEVDPKEPYGQSAIMWAAAEGHVEVVRKLLEAEADFNASLMSGYTPFHFAVREGETAVVRLLLEAGVDVNEEMDVEGSSEKLPLNGTSPLILAVENGHYDLAVELLEAGADPNDQSSGFTALHTLTWIRKPDVGETSAGDPPPRGSGRRVSHQFILELIERGADVNARLQTGQKAALRYVSDIGATPFFLAAKRADIFYMKLLVEHGADPFVPNEDGCTPLMMAAGVASRAPEEEAGTEEECLEAVKYLIELGADVNTVDGNGETAMHGAAYKNLPSMVKYLHEQGAAIEIWNTENALGWTPLLIAEGYRPGNFKPSFVTVDAITEIMLANGVKPPTDPRPKAINEYRQN
jgi:ankyrin repeat protein